MFKYAIRISSLEINEEVFLDKLNALISLIITKGHCIGCIEQPEGSYLHTHLYIETDHWRDTSSVRSALKKFFPYKADGGFKPITISDHTKDESKTMESAAFYVSKGPKAKALPGQEKVKCKVYDLQTKLPFKESRILYCNSGYTDIFLDTKYQEFWDLSRKRQNSHVKKSDNHVENLLERCSLEYQRLGPDGLYYPIVPNIRQVVQLVSSYFAQSVKKPFGPKLVADYTNLLMYHLGPQDFKRQFCDSVMEKFFSDYR